MVIYNKYNLLYEQLFELHVYNGFLNVYSWPSSPINKLYIKTLYMRLEHSSINYRKQFCISKFDKEKKRSRI